MSPSLLMDSAIKDNEFILINQSRSFSIPILNLDKTLRNTVMVQYNLNKAMDTIEDNLDLSEDLRINYIKELCDALKNNSISLSVRQKMIYNIGDDESSTFKKYSSIVLLYSSLDKKERSLCYYWMKEMSNGMCYFIGKDIEDINDLNKYCYYVAGTVGIFLTELLLYKTTGENLISDKTKANACGFGRFLQKLNIIRDFEEDKKRKEFSFWPKVLFEKDDNITILNYLCDETIANDLSLAIKYYDEVKDLNSSYDCFLRFVLLSGVEYIKLLKNNKSVFSKIKVKLPKFFIQGLYKKISNMSHEKFYELIKI